MIREKSRRIYLDLAPPLIRGAHQGWLGLDVRFKLDATEAASNFKELLQTGLSCP